MAGKGGLYNPRPVDDVPVNGQLTHGVTSNRMFDHEADVDAHHEVMPTTHYVIAHPNADQSVTQATWTQVTLDVEDADPAACFASNTLTVKKAGRWLLIARIQYKAFADQKIAYLQFYKGGAAEVVTQQAVFASGATATYVITVAILDLAVNEAIEVYTYHDNVGAIDLESTRVGFEAHLLSA